MRVPKLLTVFIAFVVSIVFCATSPVRATVGDLDTSFSDDGKQLVRFSNDNFAHGATLQSDGKVLMVGSALNGSVYNCAVSRLNSDGSLDSSFDGDGKAFVPFGFGRCVAVQSDGKIVVAGYGIGASNYDFAVARLNSNGSLDLSFDGDGKALIPAGTSNDIAVDLVLQGDGKIVVTGFGSNGTNDDFAAIRLNSNGSLDLSFDGDGKVLIPIGAGTDQAYGVALQSDGKIILSGESVTSNTANFAAVRLNSDGSLDSSFDSDGKVVVPVGSSGNQAYSAAVQNDGKIILAGTGINISTCFAAVRLNSNGSLDSGFDGDGKVFIPIGSSTDQAYSVALQSNGKIVLGGVSKTGTNNDFAVVRLNSNGSPDNSFSSDGKLTVDFGGASDFAYRVLIQSDGRIVLAGEGSDPTSGTQQFAAARVLGDSNQAPIAQSQNVTGNEDTLQNITLIASDADGDALLYSVLNGPAHGTLGGTAPNLTYTPTTNFNGSDSFTFKVNDGLMDSNTATLFLTVNAVNDNPVVQDSFVVTMEETAVDFTIEATDVDGDTLTYSIIQPAPQVGFISGTGPNFTFTPTTNFNGQSYFGFSLSDGTTTIAQNGVITVTPVNDAPTLTRINTTNGSVQGRPVTLSREQLWLLSDAADIDNEANTLQFRVESIEAGTLTSNGQPVEVGSLITDAANVTWTASADALGETAAFTVKAWDGALASATPVPVKFDVASSNNAPQAQAQNVALNEDATANITLSATDADGDALTYSIFIQPSHGTLIGTLPNVTYTPNANYNGSDSFFFTANDGKADSQPAKVSITVNSINDAPTITSIQVSAGSEDLPIAFPAHVLIGKTVAADVDNDPIYLKVESLGAGTLQIGNVPAFVGQPIYPNNYIYWTPPANANGELTVATLHAFDGSLSSANAVPWNVNLTPINDTPTAQNLILTTNEDQAVNGTLSGSDVDNDALSFRITVQPQTGTVSGTLPNFTYTPNANYAGPDSFRFVSNDGQQDSAEATVALSLTNINDAPTLSAINTLTGAFEDTPFDIAFATLQNAANEADIDNASLAFRIESVEAGTLTKTGVAVVAGTIFNAGETLKWTPPADANGTGVAFTIKAWDGQLTSSTAVPVTISVEAVSDSPIAQSQSVSTNEDTAAGIILSATDADGDALTYAIVSQPQHGILSGTAPNLTYTPAANYSGSDSFTFTASGGAIESNVATVSINITAQNDVPVASNQSVNAVEDTSSNIALGANDADGDALIYTIVSGPTNGTLSGSGANRIYMPAANYNGVDSFTFHVNDGTTNSNTATVSITIVAVNDIPTLTTINNLAGGLEDTAVSIPYATLATAANEADVESANLSFRIESVNGTLTKGGTAVVVGSTLLGTGDSVLWTPPANANGTLGAFAVKAWDGAAASATAIAVNLTVIAVNDAPTFTLPVTSLSVKKNVTAQTIPNWATNISVGPADESAQTKTFTITNSNTALFSAQPALSSTGTLTFQPAKNKTGTATITVRLQDSGGITNGGVNLSVARTFTITVN